MGNVTGKDQEPETCECGKTTQEGGCKPNYNPRLVGTIKGIYTRHILICTGTDDWEAKYLKDKSGFGFRLYSLMKELCPPEVLEQTMVTACDEHSQDIEKGSDLIIYPEKVRYNGLETDEQIKAFINEQLIQGRICEGIHHEPISYERVVLVCTHGSRDRRCGRIGPQICDSLQQILEEREIPENQVKVMKSSHIGGHKFAGVLIVYPEGDWYGEITTKNSTELIDAYLSGSTLYKNWRGKMGLDQEHTKALLSAPEKKD